MRPEAGKRFQLEEKGGGAYFQNEARKHSGKTFLHVNHKRQVLRCFPAHNFLIDWESQKKTPIVRKWEKQGEKLGKKNIYKAVYTAA